MVQTQENAPRTKYGIVPLPADGTPWDDKQLSNVRGFTPLARQQNARRQIQIRECTRMWAGFMAGEVHPFLMKEALNPTQQFSYDALNKLAPSIFHESMTTSDFTNLTSFTLDRMLLESWPTYPSVYSQIAKINNNIRDFRAVERWVLDGGELPYQLVKETAGFNRRAATSSSYSYSVAKYEGGEQMSWEMVINDDMNIFQSMPQRLVVGGHRTLDLFFTNLVADVNGPHASFYTSGNGNIINTTNYAGGSVNPPLSYQSLAGALAQLMNLSTSEGRPIGMADRIVVMVGDGMLYQVLLNIINAETVTQTVAGGTKASSAVMFDTALEINNWIASKIIPVYNPEIRSVVTASSGAVAARSWWIFVDPVANRPALEMGFLSGFNVPKMYKKASNTQSMNGGGLVEEMGDFETMGTEFKAMLVTGGTRMDPKTALASNGSGS